MENMAIETAAPDQIENSNITFAEQLILDLFCNYCLIRLKVLLDIFPMACIWRRSIMNIEHHKLTSDNTSSSEEMTTLNSREIAKQKRKCSGLKSLWKIKRKQLSEPVRRSPPQTTQHLDDGYVSPKRNIVDAASMTCSITQRPTFFFATAYLRNLREDENSCDEHDAGAGHVWTDIPAPNISGYGSQNQRQIIHRSSKTVIQTISSLNCVRDESSSHLTAARSRMRNGLLNRANQAEKPLEYQTQSARIGSLATLEEENEEDCERRI
jgi:hypothetical protein